MHARTKRFSVIGAALGLVLAAGVVVAPAATPPASAAVGCSYFKGLTVTTPTYVSINGIALQKGDTITAKVSPATTGDWLSLSGALGTVLLFDGAPATSSLTYVAPSTGSYNLGWSFDAAGTRPASLTYSFTATCSTTTVSPTPTPTPTPTATTPTKPGKGGGKGKG